MESFDKTFAYSTIQLLRRFLSVYIKKNYFINYQITVLNRRSK